MNQLRSLAKWLNVQVNPVVGQLALYREANCNPCKWPLVRIIRCLPDSNDVVRTVEIEGNGQRKVIPTTQLIHLPIET